MLKDLCFEIIQKCPNNCLFCSSCSSINKNNIIDLELFKKVIDHFIDLGGIEEISISGGEPFLHPNLFEIIEYCKKNNIRVVLFTSGIKRRKKLTDKEYQEYMEQVKNKYHKFLNEGLSLERVNRLIEKEKQIVDYYNNQAFSQVSKEEFNYLKSIELDKVVFDFQAWDKDVYDKIMGTKNYYYYIIHSIINASRSGIETDAHFIPTSINYKELPDIVEMLNVANFNNLSILNFVPQGRGYENKNELLLTDEEMQEFIKIYNKCKEDFNGNIRVGIPLIKEDKHLCTAGLSKLVIKYDGTVLPCPAFKEYDLEELNKLGIKTHNIRENLDKIKVFSGNRAKPLCKQLYNFDRSIN